MRMMSSSRRSTAFFRRSISWSVNCRRDASDSLCPLGMYPPRVLVIQFIPAFQHVTAICSDRESKFDWPAPENAPLRAVERADQLPDAGDMIGAAIWRRI